MTAAKAPIVLTILDGWGEKEAETGNARKAAHLPNYQRFWDEYPHTTLTASGEAVGLPEGQMGNSEVGHLNIGAGRVVYQELTRISRAIREKDFFHNPVLIEAMTRVKSENAVHLLGLLSDGGVHSHISHLFALLELARDLNVKKVFIHCFLDGRDVAPANAKQYIHQLEEKMAELGLGQIATVMGRYYAMDRDNRWERVALAYRAMVYGEGVKATMAQTAVEQSYEKRVTDEFVEPTVILEPDGRPKGTINHGDTVIFYNFRADRAREITRTFVDEEFQGFDRGECRPQVHYVCMTQYDATIEAPIVFSPQNLYHTLGQVIADHGMRQLRIAETEKYAHVTFFFNGGVEEPNDGEDRILIPSPKVATYNLKPEMSAYEVTDTVVEKILSGVYDLIILNYANPDMVGHTGILEAAIQAVEAVDKCLGRVDQAVKTMGGTLLITSDHGNVEDMIDEETGACQTAHSSNDVPFILIREDMKNAVLRTGSLEDIAPTILQLMGIPQPVEMTGKSLIVG